MIVDDYSTLLLHNKSNKYSFVYSWVVEMCTLSPVLDLSLLF